MSIEAYCKTPEFKKDISGREMNAIEDGRLEEE